MMPRTREADVVMRDDLTDCGLHITTVDVVANVGLTDFP